MKTPGKSLPQAISAVVLGLAASLIVVYSLLIMAYAWMVEDNIFNRLVVDEAQRLEARYLSDGVVIPPRAGFITLHPEWHNLPPKLRSDYTRDPSKIEHTMDDGRTVHLNIVTLGNRDYVLVADVQDFEVSRDYLPGLLGWLFALGLFATLLVTLIAYFSAKRVTHPLKQLAGLVADPEKLASSEGFVSNYPDNEVGTLAKAVSFGYSRLQQALEREQQFTRDVSHEMRTPLTVLATTLEAARADQIFKKDALARMERASSELQQLTETLLALARAESTVTQPLSMAKAIEEAVLQHFELNQTAPGRRLVLSLDLENDFRIEANSKLVKILLDNLITNLVRYAADPAVSIVLTREVMTCSNQISEPVPAQPEKSGARTANSVGIGQGLNLIARICEESGWLLHLTNEQGVFQVSIEFAPQ